MSAFETVEAEFTAALGELVECYTGEYPRMERGQAMPGADTYAAIVGFGADDLSGSSVLVASPAAAAALAGDAPADVRDWLGELNNQAVGRLKNKLCRYGLLLQMSTPITACGADMGFGTVGSAATATWAVRWAGGAVHAFLALTLSADLCLVADAAEAVATEGSISLF